MKTKILFVITQFFKGGAEVALLNLLHALSSEEYDIDFLIFDQIELKSAVSLIPQLPNWVNVCNAAENEGELAYFKKAVSKVYLRITKKQLYRKTAYKFVKDKEYDFAFSYGEWMSPQFVATKVKAKNKAVWIHTDIDKAQFVDEKILFGWDDKFQSYIFVSELSMKSAILKYPFLKERSYVIHNMCDDNNIRNRAKDKMDFEISEEMPILLTVANIRNEKNHLRQIEAMNILKKQGIRFKWLNVGCVADPILKHKVEFLIHQYGLEKDFLLLGADENPYKYMIRADAVCVLSDFESWSIVITEAKLLGIPVIATKTSGAIEQISNNETGILCDFSIDDIVKQIKKFIINNSVSEHIRNNLIGFNTQKDTMKQFKDFILQGRSAQTQQKKKLLYIIDNVNYISGVQKVTAYQIEQLHDNYDISIFSLEKPNEQAKDIFKNTKFISIENCENLEILNLP
ncbi:MAG: glycosyltransferase, partial [Acetivibrio sp.]